MGKDKVIKPIQERSCTDLICLFLFIAINVVMLGFAIYSWTNGNFKQLTTAYDPDRKGCGIDYPTYPYIYFASPHADSLWVTVCVSKCPQASDSYLQCQPNSVVTTCNITENSDNTKAVQIYNTSATGGKVCLPTSDTIQKQISSALGGSAEQITSLMDNYILLIIALPIAILASLLILLLIRLTASIFLYLIIIFVIAILVVLGVYLLMNPSGETGSPIQSNTTRIILAVIFFALALLIIVIVCCLRSRISLASAIIKVSSRFVTENCLVILLPLLLFLVMLFFIVLWIFQFLGFYSLGTPSHEPRQYPFQHFQTSGKIIALIIVHVFYLLWGLFFLIQTGSFIVGGTACSWFFDNSNSDAYSQSSQRYRKKHIGSVCKGSFFVALLGFIKFIYEILTPDEDKTQGCLGAYRKFCNCICCLCTGYLFKWFNNGAYTIIHIKGQSYCSAAGSSIELKLANAVQSAVVAVVQALFSFLIQMAITFATVGIVYFIVNYVPKFRSEVKDGTLIFIIVGFISFTISCFFVSVYSDAIDAIYTSYLYDTKASGSNCPPQLQEFFDEAKKKDSS